MTPERLRDLLACPVCREQLMSTGAGVSCRECGRYYPVREGVPVLIPPDSPFHHAQELTHKTRARGSLVSWLRRIARPYLHFNPSLTRWTNLGLFRHLNECTPQMRILNLGSGIGLFDEYLSDHLNFINLDVKVAKSVDVLGDAHSLPFADESLDAVYSNAVLEHVQRPWVVAEEIWRVLRPGGRVFINVPFLNVIHDVHDYFRFTDMGLDVLFSRFEKIDGGVSSGPSSFLGPFFIEYLLCFVPGQAPKILARPLLSLLAWPMKYLDIPIRRSPHLRITADAFYFVGVKRD